MRKSGYDQMKNRKHEAQENRAPLVRNSNAYLSALEFDDGNWCHGKDETVNRTTVYHWVPFLL